MVSFTSHKICTESVLLAELIKEAREARGMTLDRAADKTKINRKYLELIEAGAFGELPRGLYGKKYLTEYARFFNIDCSKYFEKFGYDSKNNASGKTRLFAERKGMSIRQIIIPKMAKNLALFLLVGSCFFYLDNRFSQVASPPKLVIASPPESLVTDQRSVDVAGVTEPESEITVNGKQILTDNNGRFSEQVSLRSGMNTITVTAKKKYGHENTVVKQILVKE